jgi:hypothetical protein
MRHKSIGAQWFSIMEVILLTMDQGAFQDRLRNLLVEAEQI